MSYATYNDLPATFCNLNRKDWRKAIFEQIEQATPPKVIAIHGTWGTGKTSELLQLYEDLGGDNHPYKSLISEAETEKKKPENKKVKTVWFEAWQYQHETNILAALLREIRNQLSLRHKIWKEVEEVAVVSTLSLMESINLTFDGFAAAFGASGAGSEGFATKFVENTKAYQKEQFSTPLDSVMLKKQLQDAIDKLLNLNSIANKLSGIFKRGKETKVEKAVIFIDDLDRCEPAVAFKILEAIKVYLNLNNCVFVLGMDIHAVYDIIAHQYEKEYKADEKIIKNRARLYLEKICQDIYFLPIPRPDQRCDFFKVLLANKIEDAALVNGLYDIAKKYEILPPFPRSIIIFVNVILTFLNVKKIENFAKKDEQQKREFLILCYLYAFHLEIYNLIVSYPTFYNNEFMPFCTTPNLIEGETHDELRQLTIYKPPAQTSPTEAMSGSVLGENETNLQHYPNKHLRQVLWIGKLVEDTKTITEAHLTILQL